MFGDAHEEFDGNPPSEKAMDLHNNSVDFRIGANTFGASNRHLAVLCAQAWSSGKLVQMNAGNNTDLIYSNSKEEFLYGGRI